MVQDLKFRLILLYHLDLWWNWKACTWTNCKSPLPTLLLWIRFSSQKPSSQGPSTVHACPWTANFNSTPAPRIIQASQSHPPLATKGHLILLIVQGSLQSPCLLSLFPSRTTVWSCVMCSPLSSPCPLCSRSTEHLSVPRISQALSCLRVSYVLFQSHGKLFAQLPDIFNNFSRWIFFLMSTHVSEQRAASLLRKGPNSKYFWLCGPVSVCQYCSTQPIVAWKQP